VKEGSETKFEIKNKSPAARSLTGNPPHANIERINQQRPAGYRNKPHDHTVIQVINLL
jgi:hypothetical protein